MVCFQYLLGYLATGFISTKSTQINNLEFVLDLIKGKKR